MIDSLWSSQGFVAGDLALAIVATICAAWSYVEIAMHRADTGEQWRVKGELAARWMVALGWTIISIRIWYALWVAGDAPIAAASVVALSLIGSGWILHNIVKGV